MEKKTTIFTEALADANAIKEAATADATLRIQEFITPKLKAILESALAEEMDDEEEKAPEEGGDEAKDESVLEKLQGLGLDETTLATLTAALEGKKEHEDEETPDEEEKEHSEEEVDETLDIDAALAEVEATFEAKKEDEEAPEEEEKEPTDEGGLSEEEINKILAEMDDEDEAPAEDDGDKLDEESCDDEDEDPKEATILELQGQLAESLKVINSLKETLTEVNLLNAKTTYLSKIFIKENLTAEHKAKVIKSFEKVKTAGEAKVLFEAFETKLQTNKTTITESLGIGKTNKKVLTESKETQWSPEALEMQRRAGIIK